MSDNLASLLAGVGISPRIIRGHRVERLYSDRWIVDGNVLNFDMAMARIQATFGDHDALEGLICTILDAERDQGTE